MAKHAEDKNKNFIYIYLIVLFLIVIGIITIIGIAPYLKDTFSPSSNSSNNTTAITASNTIINKTSTGIKKFDNAPHLHSSEFVLTKENGIFTVNGKIYNSSNNIVNNVSCIYTLKDINNNIVYEFTVLAEEIHPQSSFTFTSIVLLDLSSVVDYSVKSLNNT